MVDAEPQLGLTSPGAAAPGAAGEWGAASSSSRLDPLRRKVAVAGLILFGTLISSLGKLGEQGWGFWGGGSKPQWSCGHTGCGLL